MEHELVKRVYKLDRSADTYNVLFDMVYKDIIGDENTEKKRKNFRLRMYQEMYDIMTDTYTGREDQTLEALKIYPMRTLALEEKGDEDMFEEYDPDSIQLKVTLWRDGLESLAEQVLLPEQVKVKKQTTMQEFQEVLMSRFDIASSAENVAILKRNRMLNTKNLEVLSDSPTKTLD